ncbi:hypothetical protein BM536_008140 [Streptomyces phaeoluteigriseus]|uniref:Lipid/polyisoprenoid-binding YceI-like domain-containing protein n=1 Tax=Streptomyces phaeoluteigriseus TaxID=114686 RepID=A0A1V6MVF6_9ACTN|nr:hypothetical protein [Streptomyces phaeoluteigriseus]OQD56257.1 hypothetical protein BM536_008140 [Streptomyces phaeoluteigriseus]
MTPNRATSNCTVRRFTTVVAVALLTGLALGTAPAYGADRAAHLPEFDFSACPTVAELPAGAEPGTWRCEVMHATGHLRMGAVDEPLTDPLKITFAEGRVGGEFRQVFGKMTAEPIRVGRTPLTLTSQYGGYSDFLSDDTRRGEFDIKFAIGLAHGPLNMTSSGCSVGSGEDAVHLVLKDTHPTRVISKDPLVLAFGAQDAEFAAPRTSGCGPLSRALDRALGLPSPAGANTFDMDVTVAIRPYI